MTARARWSPRVAAALAVAAFTFLVFQGTLGHEFLNWDDGAYVTANPAIRTLDARQVGWIFSHFYYFAYIPVTILSHGVDAAVWGMNAWGHHLTNVLLHVANAAWLVLLGLALKGRADAASPRDRAGAGSPRTTPTVVLAMAAAALYFAVHPLRSESVSWVSDRKDLLCAFFFLPGLLAYLRYAASRGTPRAPALYGTTFLLFLLAVLSKTHAVTFPLVLLVVDWLTLRPGARKPNLRRLVAEKIPFLAVSLALTALSFAHAPVEMPAYSIAHLMPAERLLYPFYSLSFPLYQTLFPLRLSPIYPSVGVGAMLAGAALLFAVTGACLFMARRGRRGPLAAWLAYLILYTPNVAGLSTGMQPVADRYSYLSTMGLFVLAGAGLTGLLEREGKGRRWTIPGAILMALLLSFLTILHADRWRSSTSLWEYVVETFPATPDYFDAYLNLGVAYAQTGRPSEAAATFRKASAIDPTNAEAAYNLGTVLMKENPEAALEQFRRATAANPKHARAFYNLAIVADRLRKGDVALSAMIQAARLGSGDAQRELDSRGIPWGSPAGTADEEKP